MKDNENMQKDLHHKSDKLKLIESEYSKKEELNDELRKANTSLQDQLSELKEKQLSIVNEAKLKTELMKHTKQTLNDRREKVKAFYHSALNKIRQEMTFMKKSVQQEMTIMGQTMKETQASIVHRQVQIIKQVEQDKQQIAHEAVNDFKATFKTSHEQTEDRLHEKEAQIDELLKQKEDHYEQQYQKRTELAKQREETMLEQLKDYEATKETLHTVQLQLEAMG